LSAPVAVTLPAGGEMSGPKAHFLFAEFFPHAAHARGALNRN
jgi:hypothetical protein